MGPKRSKTARAVAGAIAALLASWAPEGFADSAAWPETAAMLAAPDDPDAVFAFADRAMAEGAPADAAAALERLVRFRPDLDEARRRLAAAYEAAGAGMMAEAAWERAEERSLSGSIAFGVGYDTNPAAIPLADEVDVFRPERGEVRPFRLDIDRDGSPFGFAQIDARFATGGEADLVVDLSAFATRFIEVDDQDDAIVSARVSRTLSGGGPTPFVDAAYRRFGGESYSASGFVGLRYDTTLDAFALSTEASVGFVEHFETALSSERDEMDGVEARALGQATTLIGDDTSARLSLLGVRRDARTKAESYFAVSLDGAATHIPDLSADWPVSLTFGGGATALFYDDADPDIDPSRTRRDLALFGYATVGLEIDESSGFDATVSYRRRFSRYDIYESDGVRATLRYVRRF